MEALRNAQPSVEVLTFFNVLASGIYGKGLTSDVKLIEKVALIARALLDSVRTDFFLEAIEMIKPACNSWFMDPSRQLQDAHYKAWVSPTLFILQAISHIVQITPWYQDVLEHLRQFEPTENLLKQTQDFLTSIFRPPRKDDTGPEYFIQFWQQTYSRHPEFCHVWSDELKEVLYSIDVVLDSRFTACLPSDTESQMTVSPQSLQLLFIIV